MIEYIKGSVTELTPAFAILETAGVGYKINISLNTYTEMQKLTNNTSTKLFIYEVIREDTHELHGFLNQTDREMFLLLISVSGVGPNTAQMIQSALNSTDLQQAIAGGNAKLLSSVKGIGAKTAQRIIVDLKDKIKVSADTLLNVEPTFSSDAYKESLAALVALGFSQQASQKALKKLFAENPALSVEAAIKQAFKLM